MSAPSAHYLDDLHTVMAVSRAMGRERDLGRLLDLIIASASKLIGADRCSLFLVDHQRGELVTRVAQGTVRTIRMARDQGIAGSVAVSGQAVNIPDAYADPRFNREHDTASGYRTRSILCMPLVNYDQVVVGVIQALNKRVLVQEGDSGTDRIEIRAFSSYDAEMLGALCSQAAVAIDNAQLIAREGDRQRLARELELAAQIQLGLLPSAAPECAAWRFAAWAKPCDETGGDYYDWLPGAGGIDMVVGDVSGHGIAAALLMSTARAFLRALHEGGGPLATLVTRLNHLLEQDLADDTFMSLAVCRCRDDGTVGYVAAGHEPPLVFRIADGRFDALDSTGPLLGMLDDADFTACELRPLAPGDVLVCATDGLWEARDRAGQEWGMERVRALIAAHACGGAQAVADALVAGVQAHLAGQPPGDDITLVVAERR